ncbi:MAG: alpha/beta fold hydrolase [Planctomycetota bacterium]|nr:alpha/beta fold hydrolase [Planctomycetota bacterium]MDA1213135.1 alpha/beta fold hydrolase [Planctomycetota bacterium]
MTEFSPFFPHPMVRGGHLQTLAGMYLPSHYIPESAVQHRVTLPDGDVVVLHENRPSNWSETSPTVLLIHGLAGCHQSPYLRRISCKLIDRGVRTFRMDLRGCGAGAGLARFPYHAGRSDDVLQCLNYLADTVPASPLAAAGFSLSGNIVLKLVGEMADELPAALKRVVAVNPPIDLAGCVARLSLPLNRIYDRFFAKHLYRQILKVATTVADAPPVPFARRPYGVWEFDEYFTAPVSGYVNAEHYYRSCSAAQFLSAIRIPTLILTSADDPLVPVSGIESAERSSAVTLVISPSGGHLGYIGKQNGDPDRRWMDWRVVEWILEG